MPQSIATTANTGSKPVRNTNAGEMPLKELAPWPDAVDGAHLFDAIPEAITNHVMVAPGAAEAMASDPTYGRLIRAASRSFEMPEWTQEAQR